MLQNDSGLSELFFPLAKVCVDTFSVVPVILLYLVSLQRLSREAHSQWADQAAHPACKPWAAAPLGWAWWAWWDRACPAWMMPVVGNVTQGRARRHSSQGWASGDPLSHTTCLLSYQVWRCPLSAVPVLSTDKRFHHWKLSFYQLSFYQ